MNKKLALFGITTTVITLVAVCGATLSNTTPAFKSSADATTYSIKLDTTNPLTEDEHTAKEFVRNTAQGNPITFSTYGGTSFAVSSGDFAISRSGNGWFKNETAISGLYKIVVKCSAKTFKVYYGETTDYEYETEELTGLGGSTELTINLARNENIKYFKWQQTVEANNWIKSIELFYTCGSGLTNRGTRFNSGENNTINLDKEYTIDSSDVVNVDVKFDADSTGKINIMLFNSASWSNYAGYYALYPTTVTGDYAGIKVTTLTDGYTRFAFKLAELNKYNGAAGSATLTTVNSFYIRGGWSEAKGYVDVTPSVPVIANRGDAFQSATNYSCDTNVAAATDKFVFDVRYTSPSSDHINVMFGTDWNNFYGYFRLDPTSATGVHSGFVVTKLSDGYIRYTVTLSEITSSKTSGTVGDIKLFYIRGGWSVATGYVDVMPN